MAKSKKDNNLLEARKKAQSAIAKRKQQQKKQQIIFISIVIVIVLILGGLIGFVVYQKSQEGKANDNEGTASKELAANLPHPQQATSFGAITISKNGLVAEQDYANLGVPVIEEVMDPICPACASIEALYGDKIKKAIEDGKIAFAIHPVGLMNYQLASKDVIGTAASETNNYQYSTRVATAFITAAEVDYSKVMNFIKIALDAKNRPQEQTTKDVSENTIASWAVQAGYTQEQAQEIVSGKYKDWVTQQTGALENSKDYRDEKGNLSTPQVYLIKGNQKTRIDPSALADIDKIIAQ